MIINAADRSVIEFTGFDCNLCVKNYYEIAGEVPLVKMGNNTSCVFSMPVVCSTYRQCLYLFIVEHGMWDLKLFNIQWYS